MVVSVPPEGRGGAYACTKPLLSGSAARNGAERPLRAVGVTPRATSCRRQPASRCRYRCRQPASGAASAVIPVALPESATPLAQQAGGRHGSAKRLILANQA